MKTKKKRLYQTNLLFLVIGILLSLSAGFHLYIVLAKQQRSDVEKLSTIYAERTESLINGIFHKTDVLAAAVKLENGDISQEEFDTLAQLVYQENSGIRGIQYMAAAAETPAATSVSGTYVLNTSSKKFHYPNCKAVAKMSAKNRQDFTGDRQELIDQGYEPCQICRP